MLGPAEEFLALVRQQVRARAAGEDQGFGQECDVRPLNPGLIEAADRLGEALEQMLSPVRRLRQALRTKLEGEADKLDSGQRAASKAWRARSPIAASSRSKPARAMLRGLHNEPDPCLRRLVRASSASSSARSMSACTATISTPPSRS